MNKKIRNASILVCLLVVGTVFLLFRKENFITRTLSVDPIHVDLPNIISPSNVISDNSGKATPITLMTPDPSFTEIPDEQVPSDSEPNSSPQTNDSQSPPSAEPTKTPESSNANKLNSSMKNVIFTYGLSSVQSPQMYTHVILAFIGCDSYGNVVTKDLANTAEQIKTFKANNPNVKVLAALTNISDYESIPNSISGEANRTKLVNGLSEFLNTYHLDGIDLDWEFYENYEQNNYVYRIFAESLRAKLGTSKVLSLSGQSADRFYRSNDIVNMINSTLDFVNVMSYEYGYEFYTQNRVAYSGSFTDARNTMEQYALVVGDANKYKLCMGLPYFGLKFKVASASTYQRGESVLSFEGKLRYDKIVESINPTAVMHTDDNGVAYYNDGTYLYVFDDTLAISTKTAYARDNGFGGAMAWVASYDSTERLQKRVVAELNKASK